MKNECHVKVADSVLRKGQLRRAYSQYTKSYDDLVFIILDVRVRSSYVKIMRYDILNNNTPVVQFWTKAWCVSYTKLIQDTKEE